MDLCKRKVRNPGDWVDRRWWYQEGINLAGERERAAAAADGEKERGGGGERETARYGMAGRH